MPSIIEIKTSYGEQQAALLNSLFGLTLKAKQVDASMPARARESLNERDYAMVRAAEGEAWAKEERERVKAQYVELDLELRAAIEIRREEIERELSPENAQFADLVAAAGAAPEALIAAMDMALSAGDEDAALVAFSAARQRDLQEVVAHALDIREDWADLYAELAEAENDKELDPGDRFEMFAQKAPSKETLFGGPPSDINLTGMMR